jgi:hypothetical protein
MTSMARGPERLLSGQLFVIVKQEYIVDYCTNFNGQVPLLFRRYGTRYQLKRTSLFA